MTQIEQIKAEIKRKKEYSKDMVQRMSDTYDLYYVGCADLCGKLLAFIDSLSDEPSEDLEEAAYDYTNNTASRSIGKAWLQRDVRLAFIRGAEWQKEQMMKNIERIPDRWTAQYLKDDKEEEK